MKKNLLSIFVVLFFVNSIMFSQGNICEQATPFCTAVGSPFVYPNVSNGSTAQAGPYYDCLLQTPNPSWFFVKTSSAGVMTFSLSQTVNADGTGGGIDVDFICWGPFSSPNNCGNLSALMVEDCSFSAASTETMTINSPGAGAYYIILITNYSGITSPPGIPGYISITQTGGASTDCSITCPPSTFTMEALLDSDLSNVPSGSTVACNDPLWIIPPNLTPAGFPYNPYTDQITPCIGINYDPYTSNLNSNGSTEIFEAGASIYTLCPSCPNSIGSGGVAPGNNLTWYIGMLDPADPHDVTFCNTGAVGPTTVSLKNCWDPSIDYAGPVTWNTSTPGCFTLSVPANTFIGTGTYSISPVSGASGLYDSNEGWAFIDPSLMPAGTTYTLTYTFNNGICAPVHGYYVFTVPATPVVTAVPSKTACSGSTVPATNFTTTPSGGSINWSNSNTAIGVAATGTSNIASYTAPTVTASTTGIFTVTATQNGCNSAAQTFSISIHPRPTPSITATNSICLGSSVTFTGSGASTYTWTGSSGNGLSGSTGTTIGATPTSTGNITYTATVTSVQGCTNTATRVLTVNPIPTANAGPSRTLTCANTSTT
ncbi:MAG: hypothetical protein IT237_13205, partial [Bacteroidia bacterium]|nr:hypothetical protein [Bacteroidia bacterium]